MDVHYFELILIYSIYLHRKKNNVHAKIKVHVCEIIPLQKNSYCVFKLFFFSEILVGRGREKSGNIDCVFSAFRCSKRLLNFPEVPSKKGSRIKQ